MLAIHEVTDSLLTDEARKNVFVATCLDRIKNGESAFQALVDCVKCLSRQNSALLGMAVDAVAKKCDRVPVMVTNECTCEISLLMSQGCKCGCFARENTNE